MLSWCMVLCSLGVALVGQDAPAGEAASSKTDPVTVKLLPGCEPGEAAPAPRFTARITATDLADLVDLRTLSVQFQSDSYKQRILDALSKISMEAVIDRLGGYLSTTFDGRFDAGQDLIVMAVDESDRVTIETPDLSEPEYRGPETEVMGLLIHDVTESEFLAASLRFMLTARQLLDTGDARYDRTSPDYQRLRAEAIVEAKRATLAAKEKAANRSEEVKEEIAKALGLRRGADGKYTGESEWLKESRRFSYIVNDGKFIQRLQPMVEEINERMALAGFAPPDPLDIPGIYFDPEIGDVDIVLPAPMLREFLAYADEFERRMAEDAVISIEAVRLTDRDIMAGALASRLNAQVQGVHDVDRFSSKAIYRELGLNALLAVANQNLSVQTLSAIAAGTFPEGVAPVQVASPTLPPIDLTTSATTIGSTFSVGADPIFFDGREQVYGFSYVSPDGIEHSLQFEVVDSLRETWSRIERNLIVHKIKKTDTLTKFTVPVGPDTKTYEGIAALISQENQQLVVATGTGAISEISATAGTWLVIEDFDIAPIPGSSTMLTEDEVEDIESRVMLTMFLRDPNMTVDVKDSLLRAPTRQGIRNELVSLMSRVGERPIRPGRRSATYEELYQTRFDAAMDEERYVKREENSVITLTFYSSQGNIIQAPGTTQLGDANDLTSFTTLLRPNVVTPISSFFTKTGNGTLGSSPLTGIDKGEQRNEDKTMTHLVIRASFPTVEREKRDRDEGRFTGYFDLPIERQPSSVVDVPFLSSSDHPTERLAKLRVGMMFDILDRNKIKKPFSGLNPNRFPGSVPPKVWETASTRLLMNRKIITDSPGAAESLASDFGSRFILEVRSLLEYDEAFFDSPNTALRNMTHWNNPDRIRLALETSPNRYALSRLVGILDDLGNKLVTDAYAHDYLAVSPPVGFEARRIHPLGDEELTLLRRDVALHYLRMREFYGDAFLEAVSNLLGLGTYRANDLDVLEQGPFHGYTDLVLFDRGGRAIGNPKQYARAHEDFLFLKQGGKKGGLFESSKLTLEDLDDLHRAAIYRGTDIVALVQ